LDKDYFLTSFNGDLILLDAVQDKGALWEPPRGMPGGEVVVEEAAGFNTEFLWKPHDGNRAAWVIPVQARPAPPVLPERTWQGERFAQADHQPATISIMNIYESDVTWPPGVVEKRQIKWLRIVQYFPKEFGPKGWPSMGRHEVKDGSPVTARMVLGVAPVEDDGSVYCQAPVGKAIYFQALDEEGMAIQNMRALTYVHPGEQMSCVGCHERKSRAGTSISTVPKALRRAPSPLEPEAGFLEPINFYRMVKPILDNKCVACHTENGKGPTDLSYDVLWEKGLQGRWGADVKKIKSGRSGNSRSIPGQGGARLSAMLAHLDPKHSKGRLTPQEVRRLIMWMDCQSNEYGASVELARQRQGDLIWPHGQQDADASIFRPLDVDPWNPAGIEVLPIVDRTVPGPITNLKAEPSTLHPFPIVLSWDPAPGVGSGLGAYAVYRDGELRTWLTGNSYADYTADPAKSHTYEIVPINRSGLAGPKSAAVQAATLPLARSTLRQN
jgi:hypothetical protein